MGGGKGSKSTYGSGAEAESHYNVMDDFSYKSTATCAYYMSSSIMNVVSMIGNLVVDWSATACAGASHVTKAFPAGDELTKWGGSEDMASDSTLLQEMEDNAKEIRDEYSGKSY